jgi:hypothetical protein
MTIGPAPMRPARTRSSTCGRICANDSAAAPIDAPIALLCRSIRLPGSSANSITAVTQSTATGESV